VIAGASVAALILVLGIVVGVGLTRDRHHPTHPSGAASAALVSAVTGVPAQTLDQVSKGNVSTAPSLVNGQPVLRQDDHPLVMYVGAEYCPYCAAQRWAMVVALSRFGTFTHVGQTHSAADDAFPNSATLSFHGATYTSPYLTFQGIETHSNQRSGRGYVRLDTLTAGQQRVVDTFDAAPYVPAAAAGGIPFIDFANQAVMSGASFSPEVLVGKTADQIAAALANPQDPIAQAVNGTANAFTTVLCRLTGNQPAAVCSSRAATAYQGALHAAG
jgi:hypothetical protein